MSGNPKGRPKGKGDAVHERILRRILNKPVRYRENGKEKIGSQLEILLKRFAAGAAKGDVGKADLLLRWYKNPPPFAELNGYLLVLSEDEMNA